MSPADTVVAKLDGVKQVGPAEWVARCPAHDDKSPSLALREADDGRLLVHCFAGCSAVEVMAALGLCVSDLFAGPLEHHKTTIRHPFSPAAVLKAIKHECLVVAIAGHDAMDGKLTDADRVRMVKAIERITEAARYA